MKGKSNNFNFNRDFLFNKYPEYFNSRYFLLTIFLIILYSLYTLISIPLYIYYHLFGDIGLLENNGENPISPSLKEENMNYFKINDISLFWNIFNNIYIIGLIIMSFLILNNQKFSHFSILIILQLIFIFSYLMNCNITLIPHKSSFAYTIFNLMIIFSFISQIIYLITFIYRKKNKKEKTVPNNKETLIGKYSINNREMTIDSFVEEIQLRMDMAKMKFNSILIKLKLNKIFKKIMFKPKDYYFMKKDNQKEKINEHIIQNVKGYKSFKNKDNVKSVDNSHVSDNNSTTFDSSVDNNYSKLNEDSESSPLNI